MEVLPGYQLLDGKERRLVEDLLQHLPLVGILPEIPALSFETE